MKRRALQFALIAVVSLVWVADGSAAEGKKAAQAAKKIIVTPDAIRWQSGPPEIPDAQMAVLDGDPKKSGIFVIRVKLPAGTKVPPHVHGNVERVTVLSGKLNMAMGESRDNPVALPAGSYFSLPTNTLHNVWTDEESVIQVTTMGPWSMHVKKGGKKGAGSSHSSDSGH